MATENQYRGVVVPMISPFTPDGAINTAAVPRIVERLLSGRVAGIFPLGTTGESASIPAKDRRVLVEATVKVVNERATVYAGISGNCLRESLEAAADHKKMGVNAVVAHMPSYYPLSDAEIENYFRLLADKVPLPLVLYNIPVTTHHSIALGTVERLMPHGNIVAIKDSSGDAPRLTELLKLTGGRDGFPVLLGASVQFTHGLKQGGVGLIPSGAHLVPDLYQQMFEAAMRSDWPRVEQMQKETDAAVSAYLKGRTVGQGLAALKAILEKQGICGRTMLPPLITEETYA